MTHQLFPSRCWGVFVALLISCANLPAGGLPPLQEAGLGIPLASIHAPWIAGAASTNSVPPTAADLGPLYDTATLRPDPSKARVRVWLDEFGLGVSAEIRDSHVIAAHTGRDTPHHEGDVFEVFLQPDPSRPHYLEIQVAPNGAVFDALLLDRYWGGIGNADAPEFDIPGLIAAARVRKGEGWSVLLRVPSRALKGNPSWPPQGQKWRANFVVVDRGQVKGPARTWHWSPSLRGGFPHVQERFGWFLTPRVGKD